MNVSVCNFSKRQNIFTVCKNCQNVARVAIKPNVHAHIEWYYARQVSEISVVEEDEYSMNHIQFSFQIYVKTNSIK